MLYVVAPSGVRRDAMCCTSYRHVLYVVTPSNVRVTPVAYAVTRGPCTMAPTCAAGATSAIAIDLSLAKSVGD